VARHAHLVPYHLLDPRVAADALAAPIADAVNIPLAELPHRTHELPARDEAIRVVGPAELAAQTVAWLQRNGRKAVADSGACATGSARGNEVGHLWRPAAWLAAVLPRLRPGTALDLACGSGRDAVYMAGCGWKVVGVDVLPDALERATDLARRCSAAIKPIEWRLLDLEQGGHLPFPVEHFDLIVGFRYLHRPLFARFGEWVKPGGSVVWETFTTEQRKRYGKPARDEHVLHLGELPGLLPGFEVRQFAEGWHGTAHTARIWAVKL
jgi:tellurite methyltransferase